MKAVSIAVCIALVGQAAASIISKRFKPQVELMMEPSDYVDQYQIKFQSQEQYQPQYQMQEKFSSQYAIQNEQKFQPQYQMQSEKYQPQYEKQQKYQIINEKDHIKVMNEKYQPQYQIQNEVYQPQNQIQSKYQNEYQIENQKYLPQYQMENDIYQQKYMTQKDKKSQATKYQKQQQKSIRSKKLQKPNDSKEDMVDDISHAQSWEQPLFAPMSQVQEVAPAYGDVITWRDIQIADGPNSPVTDRKEIESIFEDAYETMVHVKPEDKHAIHTAFEAAVHDHDNYAQAQMNATQLIRSHGYMVSEHTVRTADGYVLTVLRMAAPKDNPKENTQSSADKRVVLMMPGLLGSAEDWLLMGPEHSLAYRLADAGHDVWLGAFRGGRYGRKHASMHPEQDEFWHFSIDELALQDVPATIDHVLRETERPALHYVAHSLGVTAALELLATEPEYNDKVAGVFALAPLVHTAAARSPLLRMLSPGSSFHALLTAQLGDAAFRPPRSLLLSAGGALLQAELGCANVSGNARLVLTGARMDDAAAAAAMARAVRSSDVTSTRVIKQLAAAASTHRFARYDRGARVNRAVYGAAEAPAVDMARVSAPVYLLPASMDWMTAKADLTRLAMELPRATTLSDARATSTDLLFSERSADPVNDRIMRAIASNAAPADTI